VSEQPAYPVFCLRTKSTVSSIQFSARYET